MIKKADIVLFFVLLAFGLALSWNSLFYGAAGNKVLITVDGQPYGTYSLYEDNEIEIENENQLIDNGNQRQNTEGSYQVTQDLLVHGHGSRVDPAVHKRLFK